MWNIMLDEKPQMWNGYPVNTDFRTGVQIYQIFNDPELSNNEKIMETCELLFPGIMPQEEEIQECIEWFLTGWYKDGKASKSDKKKVFDFDIDQWRIYSAFLLQFHIDLNIADLHYWEFMGLLSTLEECAFTRINEIRQKKIDSKMSPETKKALHELKKIYAIDAAPAQKHNDEEAKVIEQEAIQLFLENQRKNHDS